MEINTISTHCNYKMPNGTLCGKPLYRETSADRNEPGYYLCRRHYAATFPSKIKGFSKIEVALYFYIFPMILLFCVIYTIWHLFA